MPVVRWVFADLTYSGLLASVLITGMVCICALIYEAINPRPDLNLNYLQSLFFMYDNFARAGLGNYFPTTTGGRIYICFLLIFLVPTYTIVILYSAQIYIQLIFLKPWVKTLNFLFPCCRGTRFTDRKSLWAEGPMVAFFTFIFCMIFTAAFRVAEGWSYGDTVYFIIVTITTVAYGDLVPLSPVGQGLYCIYCALGLAIYAIVLGILSNGIMKFLAKRRARVKEKLKAMRRADRDHNDDPQPPADIAIFDEAPPDLPPSEILPFSDLDAPPADPPPFYYLSDDHDHHVRPFSDVGAPL